MNLDQQNNLKTLVCNRIKILPPKNHIILNINKLRVYRNAQLTPIVQLYERVYEQQFNVYTSRTFLYKSSLLSKALDAKHTLAIQAR